MIAGKMRLSPPHIALWAAILTIASWAAAAVSPSRPNRLAIWPQGAGSPAFDLINAEGTPRTLRDYRGRVVVIYFGFLHCPDACPATLFKLALVMKQLGQIAAHVQVLFITLDPERDTPALLQSYVSAFDRRFVGLTGTAAQVDLAASSFNVQYARVSLGSDYTIDHTNAAFVLDGAGRLRLIGAANSSVGDFVHDITALAMELSATGR
jgi:protein SCO1/2